MTQLIEFLAGCWALLRFALIWGGATVALMAVFGPWMKRSREKQTKSQAVLNKSGRGDIRIK